MLRQKRPFEFGDQGTPLSPELRQARSLEYIAHYLELIEGHLARLANADPSLGQIGQSLAALAQVTMAKK